MNEDIYSSEIFDIFSDFVVVLFIRKKGPYNLGLGHFHNWIHRDSRPFRLLLVLLLMLLLLVFVLEYNLLLLLISHIRHSSMTR